MHRFKFTAVALVVAGMALIAPEAGAISWWGDLIPHAAEGYGDRVDALYYFIYWVTGLTFVGVQGTLLYFCWRYREHEGNTEGIYSHGSHKLEVIWTITPAVMLIFLALIQQSAWMDIKTRFPKVAPTDGSEAPLRIQILGRQFNWFFRYAGPDNKFDTFDDYVSASLVIPKGRTVLAQIRSEDVLHSFFLPYHRVKQDTVPGLTIPIWFHSSMTSNEYALKHNKPLIGPNPWTFEVACAELCGQGHTRMRAVMKVLSVDAFEAWEKKNTRSPWDAVGVTRLQLRKQFRREFRKAMGKKSGMELRKAFVTKHWGWAWAKNDRMTKIEGFQRGDKWLTPKKKSKKKTKKKTKGVK